MLLDCCAVEWTESLGGCAFVMLDSQSYAVGLSCGCAVEWTENLGGLSCGSAVTLLGAYSALLQLITRLLRPC